MLYSQPFLPITRPGPARRGSNGGWKKRKSQWWSCSDFILYESYLQFIRLEAFGKKFRRRLSSNFLQRNRAPFDFIHLFPRWSSRSSRSLPDPPVRFYRKSSTCCVTSFFLPLLPFPPRQRNDRLYVSKAALTLFYVIFSGAVEFNRYVYRCPGVEEWNVSAGLL